MLRTVSKRERRYSHPPRITLRVILAFVVVMALFNVPLLPTTTHPTQHNVPIDGELSPSLEADA